MFSVKVETSDGQIKNFTAQSFYQVIVGEGKIKVLWVKTDGKDESVTYARIRTIVEKKIT